MTQPEVIAELDHVARRFANEWSLGPLDVTIRRGDHLAVTGPSGSGKSTLLHLLAMIDRPTSGRIRMLGLDTTVLSERRLDAWRRGRIGLALQDDAPYTALSVRDNLALAYQLSGRAAKRHQALALTEHTLHRFELEHRACHRPEQLSGGERSRLAMARAVVCGRDLVVLDEPTASLEPRLSHKLMAQVLDANNSDGPGVVIATHDPAVSALCARSIDLAGSQPLAPPPLEPARGGPVVLEASEVHKSFNTSGARLVVLRGVSLAMRRGECLCLTGPSGSGKSTLLAILAGIDGTDAGRVWRLGAACASPRDLDRWRAQCAGLVVQRDALGLALSPLQHLSLQQTLARRAGSRRIFPAPAALLRDFGLEPLAQRVGFRLSGGERRRVALARALAHAPDVILADEPTAGLHSSMAQHVARLLRQAAAMGCAVLFTTHDPALAAMADRTLVLADGKLVEANRG